MITIIDIEKAISIIEDSRYTHELWIDFYKDNPEREIEHAKVAGDTNHHIKCVEEYTFVLNLLESLK